MLKEEGQLVMLDALLNENPQFKWFYRDLEKGFLF